MYVFKPNLVHKLVVHLLFVKDTKRKFVSNSKQLGAIINDKLNDYKDTRYTQIISILKGIC